MMHSPKLRDRVLSLRGVRTAAQVARETGLSRSAVLGIWHRARGQVPAGEARRDADAYGIAPDLRRRLSAAPRAFASTGYRQG